MPTGQPIEAEFAQTRWVIEIRKSPDLDCGRRQVRVFHYGSLVCSYGDEWYSGWEYPENTQAGEEDFYIQLTPEQLLMDEDADIPRIDRDGNVGLWIKITDVYEDGTPPFVDMYYVGNATEDDYYVPRFDYDVLFASEREIVG